MKNRERNERIEIRLTEEERTIFEKKMKMAKCKTMSHFIRKCVMESDIYSDDIKDMQSQIEHLSKEIWDIHSLLVKKTK